VLTVIEEKSKISKAQRQLEKTIRKCSPKKGTITIGGQWGHGPQTVSWFEELGIWWAMYPLNNRYENAFGVEEPRWRTKYGHSIPCIIDIPFQGINRRIGGAFSTDENNRVYLMHRGRIGGGKRGIGKKLFVENYRGEWKAVRDGNSVSTLALIAELGTERFPHQVAHFVHEVQRIKGEVGKPKPDLQLSKTFKEEFSGKRKYSLGEVEAECDHGLVVGELAQQLQQMGFAVGNRYPMDLYIVSPKGSITALFEVKTDSTPTSCYESVGQLFFYSVELPKKPQLVAVFPDSLGMESMDIFDQIGVKSLTYRWTENKPFFDKGKIAGLIPT
jgi:hypothetical protein